MSDMERSEQRPLMHCMRCGEVITLPACVDCDRLCAECLSLFLPENGTALGWARFQNEADL